MRDLDAMTAFCADHHARVLGLVLARVRDRDVAEELAQDVLVAVCDRWDRVSNAQDPLAYVMAMARNHATSSWRRRLAGRRAAARLAARRPSDPTEHAFTTIDTRPTLAAALAELTAREREVLVLRFVVDLDVARTAVVLGIAEGTVRSLTHRAVQRLRNLPAVLALADDTGRDDTGRASTGREGNGRVETGRSDADRDETEQFEAGRQDTSRDATGWPAPTAARRATEGQP